MEMKFSNGIIRFALRRPFQRGLPCRIPRCKLAESGFALRSVETMLKLIKKTEKDL